MNLDELVTSIPEADLKAELSQWVDEWKKDSSDVNRLYELIAKWHGNTWFVDQAAQDGFWANLQSFKQQAIDGLGGMTVNERLYWFGLFDDWDSLGEAGKERLRAKLHANA
ncbi:MULTISPECIES: hypothetical protein [unclassified Marinobacter]|uniref:hypothetical protein n=1 Tax=unclassified Marinobacter TaxID=83889 RepID=UPI001268D648|nr:MULTISPECIES: hypothetical protein [unclassified Marinobacter]QFS87414.1 hypothetical protein FIV08_11300 [Marinobacter sp. THAF197a]QFT51198.1 hypothetical protein FIU96_11210 [Marinobacter sp. THAF39]